MGDGLPCQADVRPKALGSERHSGVVTLLFTDVVGSTALKQRLGDREGVELVQQHHTLVREVLSQFEGAEEIVVAGDSFLIVFPAPSEAVRCALVLQRRLAEFNVGRSVRVSDRMGVHMGEVRIEPAGTGQHKVQGIQVDTCARVMSLAHGGQVLMTRSVFDNARQSLKGEEIEGTSGLEWLNHGRFELKGVDELVEICEVRPAGVPSLAPPTTSEKARRVESAEGEAVLGWRPAVCQLVPNTKWILEEKLGEGGFGEVWKARHEKLAEQRVFKFCFRADRVRSLKREATLFRLLKERVGDHPNIVRLYDIYLDEPPFYLEEEYVAGKDLRSWCEAQGGIAKVPLEVKLELVAQAADALQAAHDSGVIHRDVKPGNMLIAQSSIKKPQPATKLTDFGIGLVLSEECLKDITRAGFTKTMLSTTSSHSGTQLYMAPELLAGKPASIRSDIYSLGVVLYQVLMSDFSQPVTGDWSKEMKDPVLRDVLQGCLAGKPDDRFTNAGELAQQLRRLPQRRARAARKAVLARLAAAVLGLAATVALGWGLFHGYVRPKGEPSGGGILANSGVKSVAVLPFDNFSVERDTEYLSDGFTEEITSVLSRIAGLKVTARNSAFAFKGKNEDIRKIGELLRVSTVLEGSVRKEGNQVRVTAQLVNASDGYQLWSESYDRSVDHLLTVQEEIARKIAEKLQGKESAGVVQSNSTDPEAYKLYLRARFFWNKRTEPGLKEAITLFQEAIKQDANYAEAHAGLAASYFVIPVFSWVNSSNFYYLARVYANRALELNPESAEAHAVLAQLQRLAGDFKGAEEHYRVAIKVNPNYATAHHWYGQYLSSRNRREEGLQQLKAAVDIDPLSPAIRSTIPEWYYLGGDCDRAVDEAEKVIKIFPDYLVVRQLLIESLAAKGAYQEALDAIDRARALLLDPLDDLLRYRAFLLARLGRENEARLLLEQARQKATKDRPIEPVAFMVYFGLRDYESAITALEQMAQAGLLGDRELGRAPFLKELRNNPRFQKLVDALKTTGTGSAEPTK
jgi:TolB-like protein/class 3 adenylate cyclase/Flp pilus assembly protein TadD/tRNA A-37 threonylcarbamoyl transferase component Bud32